VLESWIVAIQGLIKPPECNELAAPLQALRAALPELAGAGLEAEQVVLTPEVDALVGTVTGGDVAGGERLLRRALADRSTPESIVTDLLLPAMGEGGRGGTNPLLMYKVYPDGREELVRGAEIARIDFKAFKRIMAAGDTPFVRNTSYGLLGQTVAVPALLFEELDLAKIDRDFDKPPILPTPLAREVN